MSNWHHRRQDGTFDRLPTAEDADEHRNVYSRENGLTVARHYGDFDPRCKVDFSQHSIAWHPKPVVSAPEWVPPAPQPTEADVMRLVEAVKAFLHTLDVPCGRFDEIVSRQELRAALAPWRK
jgi:hypothetical protein